MNGCYAVVTGAALGEVLFVGLYEECLLWMGNNEGWEGLRACTRPDYLGWVELGEPVALPETLAAA